jgi:hypothetical protein
MDGFHETKKKYSITSVQSFVNHLKSEDLQEYFSNFLVQDERKWGGIRKLFEELYSHVAVVMREDPDLSKDVN